jgi:hypothetical protein
MKKVDAQLIGEYGSGRQESVPEVYTGFGKLCRSKSAAVDAAERLVRNLHVAR